MWNRIIRASGLLFFVLGLVFIDASQAQAERLMVSSTVANIRSGPGTTFEVLWQVEQYHPLQIVEKKGNWYKFTDFAKIGIPLNLIYWLWQYC